MRQKLNKEEKKVKISITLCPKINKKMEDSLINKSKLVEKLLIDHYGDKN